MNVMLPQTVGVWTLTHPAKRVQPKEIFDYMDGAGELYLGYRFNFLDVYEYESTKDDTILVELYSMQSSDDAYGLLSGDWGGEPVDLSSTGGAAKGLYGAGLLRVWSGDLYARVMAYQETAASREAVLALGKAIVAGRPVSAPPSLVRSLPPVVDENALRDDRTVFLRSHLVLNSVYFLSSENLLNLNLECEAVAASYRPASAMAGTKAVRVLLVRYPTESAARDALKKFQELYLAVKNKAPATDDRGAVRIEDGWAGFILTGKAIGLVFESPDETSTRLFLETSKQALDKVEALHE